MGENAAAQGQEEGPPVQFTHKIFKRGDQLKTGGKIFEVEELVRYGEFGDSYRVRLQSIGTRHYLLTEADNALPHHKHLKTLAELWTELEGKKEEVIRHYLLKVAEGHEGKMQYVVCQHVGPTLPNLRRYYLHANLPAGDAIDVAIQTYLAVEHLHQLGFVHGDLSPAAFCMGMNEQENLVYMVHLGRLRRFTDKATGKPLKQRPKASFLGNLIYCSRATHRRQDYGRKDDLESWLYLVADIFDDAQPPWKPRWRWKPKPEDDLLKKKEGLFANQKSVVDNFFKYTPHEFQPMLEQIERLSFDSLPNYLVFRTILSEVKQKVDKGKKPRWTGHSIAKIKYPKLKRPTPPGGGSSDRNKRKSRKGGASIMKTSTGSDDDQLNTDITGASRNTGTGLDTTGTGCGSRETVNPIKGRRHARKKLPRRNEDDEDEPQQMANSDDNPLPKKKPSTEGDIGENEDDADEEGAARKRKPVPVPIKKPKRKSSPYGRLDDDDDWKDDEDEEQNVTGGGGEGAGGTSQMAPVKKQAPKPKPQQTPKPRARSKASTTEKTRKPAPPLKKKVVVNEDDESVRNEDSDPNHSNPGPKNPPPRKKPPPVTKKASKENTNEQDDKDAPYDNVEGGGGGGSDKKVQKKPSKVNEDEEDLKNNSKDGKKKKPPRKKSSDDDDDQKHEGSEPKGKEGKGRATRKT